VRRAFDRVLVAFALALLLAPIGAHLADWEPMPSVDEQRTLAPLPPLGADKAALLAFPAAFEAWHDDRFGLRASLIHAHAWLKVALLDLSPTQKVAIGRDGWLYYATPQAIDATRCATPFPPGQLDSEREIRERRRDWLAARGIAYLDVWAPDKNTVYPEHLPRWLAREGTACRLPAFIAHMQARSTVPVLDLSPPLLDAARAQRVYSPSDSHWNARGALVAAEVICGAIAWQLQDLRPLTPDRVRVVTIRNTGGDLARMVDLGDRFASDEVAALIQSPRASELKGPGVEAPKGVKVRVWENPGAKRRLLAFHDSFGVAPMPFLAESFARVVSLEFGHFDEALVERERPDVVIELHVERQLSPANE